MRLMRPCSIQVALAVTTVFAGAMLLWNLQMTSDSLRLSARNCPLAICRDVQKQCVVPKSFYFLKMFKTGSTTIYNMIARLVIDRNLRWAAYQIRPYEPLQNTPEGAMMQRIMPKFRKDEDKKYNVIADHSVYDENMIGALLEGPVTYITFLRHPLSQLRSFFVEIYGSQKKDPANVVLGKAAQMGRKILKNKSLFIFVNPFARQFGFPENVQNTTDALFAKHLAKISKTFFVGITEYFSTSVILMRRKLCLKWRDVVYLSLRKTVGTRPRVHDAVTLAATCRMSALDCYLYDYFNQSLWREVNTIGVDLREEVRAFDETLQQAEDYCGVIHRLLDAPALWATVWARPSLYINATRWSEAFKITPKLCALMRVEERALGSYFLLRQNWEMCEAFRRVPRRICPIYDKNVKGMDCPRWCQHSKTPGDLLDNLLKDKAVYLKH